MGVASETFGAYRFDGGGVAAWLFVVVSLGGGLRGRGLGGGRLTKTMVL